MDIQRPSYIKLKIYPLTDSQGTDIDVSTVYLIFDIKDRYGHTLRAISDPSGVDSVNTVIEDNVCYVLIRETQLQGCLEMSVGIRSQDPYFPGGYCQTFSEFKPLNINYV